MDRIIYEYGGSDTPAGDETKAVVDVSLNEFIDLICYCDNVAKILKDNGFKGKAEALQSRYMKFAHLIKT